MTTKRVYFFGGGKADGNGTMKDVLGGKGAGLAEMTNLGRAGAAGVHHLHRGLQPVSTRTGESSPRTSRRRSRRTSRSSSGRSGKKLGDPKNPLLVSVRSGAKFSMPGMMDTVLNLGLNDETVEGLARKSGNPRFAYDCYRRFLQMFGDVVLDIAKEQLRAHLRREEAGARRRPTTSTSPPRT